MELLENLQKLKRQLTRGEFEKRFPHPWLIRELDEDELHALFKTQVTFRKGGTAPTPPSNKVFTPREGLARLLAVDVARFGIYPLAKSGSNPWSERIQVGRSTNNDIVLRNDRISKNHAYFQCGARGIWRIHDARSVNGTRVDGELVPPGEEGVEIHVGQSLAFGTVMAELVSSGTLYDAL